MNKPDGDVGKRKPSTRNSAFDNAVGATNNNLPESDDSDERQAYFYEKPKIPFDLPESTNIHTNTVPPKTYLFLLLFFQFHFPLFDSLQRSLIQIFNFSNDVEDFDGYQYPKPAVAFPLPTTTANPDAESLPTDSARFSKG